MGGLVLALASTGPLAWGQTASAVLARIEAFREEVVRRRQEASVLGTSLLRIEERIQARLRARGGTGSVLRMSPDEVRGHLDSFLRRVQRIEDPNVRRRLVDDFLAP